MLIYEKYFKNQNKKFQIFVKKEGLNLIDKVLLLSKNAIDKSFHLKIFLLIYLFAL